MKINKKTMSLVLGTTLFLSTAASAAAFEDIEGHWAKESVEKLVEEKVINGYDDGTFKPDNPIKREEAAKMVSAYFDKLVISKGAIKSFSDVNSGMWSEVYINSMVDAEIINGYPDGSFKPGNSIKRAEASKMIYEALENTGKYKNNGVSVSLSDIEGHWAGSAIEKLVAMGAIKGYSSGEFRPENDITRAELAKILNSLGIPLNERSDKKSFKVSTEFLPEVFGVMLNDSVINKDNLEGKILEGVTAKDEENRDVKSMKILEQDLEAFDKTSVGTQSLRILFEDDDGRTDLKTIEVIVTDFEYGLLGEGGVIINGIKGVHGEKVAVPREINGGIVFYIESQAFKDNTTIKELYISKYCKPLDNAFLNSTIENIVMLGSGHRDINNVIAPNTFRGMKELKRVRLPKDTERIPEGAFKNLEKLRDVVIPEGVEKIEKETFRGCSSLKEISIPKKVKIIDEYSFAGSGLENIYFEDNSELTHIYRRAFKQTGLKEIKIPKSTKYIAAESFMDTSLSSLEFEPNSNLVGLGEGTFKNCNLEGLVKVPKKINVINFYDSSKINILPDAQGLKDIEKYCFDEAKVNLDWMQN